MTSSVGQENYNCLKELFQQPHKNLSKMQSSTCFSNLLIKRALAKNSQNALLTQAQGRLMSVFSQP